MTDEAPFWERLSPRAQAAGALATIEDPETVVRLVLFTLLGAAASTAGFAVLFFFFVEAVAGWSTLVLATVLALASVWYVLGRSPGKVVTAVTLVTVIAATNHITVHLALGGYANSGAYLMWGIAIILTSSLTLSRRAIIGATSFYLTVAVIFGFLEESLAASRAAPDPTLSTILFVRREHRSSASGPRETWF